MASCFPLLRCLVCSEFVLSLFTKSCHSLSELNGAITLPTPLVHLLYSCVPFCEESEAICCQFSARRIILRCAFCNEVVIFRLVIVRWQRLDRIVRRAS